MRLIWVILLFKLVVKPITNKLCIEPEMKYNIENKNLEKNNFWYLSGRGGVTQYTDYGWYVYQRLAGWDLSTSKHIKYYLWYVIC